MESTVDLDSLLQSHVDEEDSASPDHRYRTVDEILLNHSSSSSPSPPSSPSTSYSTDRRYFRRPLSDEVSSYRNPKLSHSSSSSLIESEKYNYYNSNAGASTDVNRTKYSSRISPQLFGTGVIRSNVKPGAALAAAAAASRSIPTPHAVAIKLRRAGIGSSIQRSVSETMTRDSASDELILSPLEVDSRVSENGSNSGIDLKEFDDGKSREDEAVALEQFRSGSLDLINGKEDIQQNSVKDVDILRKDETLDEADDGDELVRVDNVKEEFTASNFEFQNDSDVDNVKDSVLDEINVNGKNEAIAEVLPSNNSGENKEMAGPSPITYDANDDNGNPKGEEELAMNSGNLETEHRVGDDASSQSDVTDIIEDLVSRRVNKTEDIPRSSLKPLELAEEIEKKQAFTGMHYEEGAAAQPMRLEGVRNGSTVLGYFDVNAENAVTRTISSQTFRRDHGSPQVLAVHLNYIAVGMSKGTILVVQSKYTVHRVDNMDAKILYLGLQGERSNVPVTSACFNHQGDLLFSGYGDGHYTVWDVQKASALKVVTEHKAPVVHMLYLGQDSQVTRQFNVVSGDSKGVVKLIPLKVVPWLNMISYTKSLKLLDETTSTVVCASSPSLFGGEGTMMSNQGSSSVSTTSSTMGSVVDEGIVIFITQKSALVAKVSPSLKVYATIPRPAGVSEGAMPYAAMKYMAQSPSSENSPVETSEKVILLAIAWDRKIQVAKLVNSELKLSDKWDLESPAIGLTWLDDQMLTVLTSTSQLYMFTRDGTVIHHTSFSVDGFRGDDLLSYHLYFTNVFGNPEKSYHNSVGMRGATVYILGSDHLVVCRLLPWKERIEVLRKAGDWMGALNMALTLYDGEAHGVIDLPKNLNEIQMSVMPYLVELLQSYVSEVFSYLKYVSGNQVEQSDEVKEQYTRVGGVAVEFCVHIRRTDILFDEIISKFVEAHRKDTFLELLEPYILKDMLGFLPPEIMQALVEHYCKRGWLQRIEQCVLHMDILSLDFNQVVLLCREHRLHGALIYLFNKGLDDFRTPLEELLVVLRNSTKDEAASLGYRMLVYLKYCFQGLAFPPGHGNLSPTRLPSLRKELLLFLLEFSSASKASAVTRLPSNGSYANLLHLLELDTEATLDVLKFAFTENELPHESTNLTVELAESKMLVQNIINILADILGATNYFQTGSCDDIETWPSKKDAGHMYDFIAYYVSNEQAIVSRDVLIQILEYLTSEVNNSCNVSVKRREKQLLFLLEVVPETLWDIPYLLHLCEKAQFHQVCGYIHSLSHQHVSAMESYMKIENEPIHAFSFIHGMLPSEESDTFESAVISHIPDLVKLSREASYFLIANHLSGKTQSILSELRLYPESLFLYLKTVIEVHTTGTINLSHLNKVDILDLPSSTRSQTQSNAYLEAISGYVKRLNNNPVHVNDEMMELYFELLCRYDRESVLQFLETCENYRVEQCLRLCQEYGIVDAASFLLERVGEVGSALTLILSNLSEKFVKLYDEVKKGCDNLAATLKKKEVAEILHIVRSCIGLCQRNSPRLDPDEAEYHWFQLMDSFFELLKYSGHGRTDSVSGALDGSSNEVEYAEGHKGQLSLSKHMTMRKLFSIFVKEIVEGMIGYVRLPRIMLKLLSDNGNQEFGDFKLTILGMLGTYDFERRILDTAKNLIEDDTYYTMSLLRKGASHGYAPKSLVCCICNSFLTKNTTSDSSVQVFICGHAMHLQCEVEASYCGGCPICTPRKKALGRSNGKSVFEEKNGITSSKYYSSSRTQAMNQHDHEGSDNSYSSRFELLNKLQKDQKLIQLDNTMQLRLAPPAVYHEKVKKRIDTLAEESSSSSSRHISTTERSTRNRPLRNVKLKGSAVRSPLKSKIFGKETISKK